MLIKLTENPERPGLYLTEDGRVFKELPLSPGSGGYTYVHHTDNKTVRRHVLVLETFSGPRQPGQVARHLNGNPSDDSVGNLVWGTQSENAYDTVAHGKNKSRKNAKLTLSQVVELKARVRSGEAGSFVCSDYGISHPTLCDIMAKRTWKEIP